LAVVLLVRALTVTLPRRGGILVWTVFAVVIGMGATLVLPGNLMATRANRIGLAVTEEINWEVAMGDTTAGSDARRCALYERLEDVSMADRARSAVYINANAAFEHYHGQAFCSDPAYPGPAR